MGNEEVIASSKAETTVKPTSETDTEVVATEQVTKTTTSQEEATSTVNTVDGVTIIASNTGTSVRHLEQELDTSNSHSHSNPDMDSSNLVSNRSVRESSKGGMCDAFYGFLFPKLAPLRWTTFLFLTILSAIPTALYILGFTKMGYGKQVFSFIEDNLTFLRLPLMYSIIAFSFLLYLLDIQHWSSKTGDIFRKLYLLLTVLAIATLIFASSSDHPYGPIALYIIFLPFYLFFTKFLFYNSKPNREFIHWLSGPLFAVAICTVVVWTVWTLWATENEWNLGIALDEAPGSGCVANDVDYPECYIDDELCFEFDADTNTLNFDNCYYGNDADDGGNGNDDGPGRACQQVYAECYNPFIIWVGPFLTCLGLLFLSFLASFLRGDGSTEQEASKFAKVWTFLLFAMWVTTSLAGAGAGVSTTLMALTLALFVASAVFINVAFNYDEKREKMDDVKDHLMEKYGGYMDIFRGLLVVTSTPLFFIYLVISFVVQRIRNVATKCYTTPPVNTESLRDIPGEGWFTIEGRRILRLIKGWNITPVFTYALYWGLAFMIMGVIVSQYTIVFLSWLIETTSHMSLVTVTFILVGVGMTMFLLPPVPGVPIYLTLGIVIVPVGQELMGVTLSICYAVVVSLILKLCACTLQQKLIGGMLQHKVSVRQFVGINSNIIRAMKLVLQEPGLGIAKVCILVGGPDWPTSVLCGIMDLALFPILFGTLPIIFLIIPTLLTGSFTYMTDSADENTDELLYPWAGTMATVFAAITALVQFGSMVVAAFFLERVMEERKEEMAALPIDEEVKRADERDEAHKEAYAEVSHWSNIPFLAKFILTLALTCMIVSCYMVQLFTTYCFRDYQLTYTIEDNLDGDWTSILRPLGVVANLLFAASVVLLMIFTSWANRKASKKLASEGSTIIPDYGNTSYAVMPNIHAVEETN